MSYRDLRNFSEAMRSLGYPAPLSLESFRSPNFELVERVLRWLAARLEPEGAAALRGGSHTIEQRVTLITDAVAFFMSAGAVRLSGRRLYAADGWAVRELLKAAALLQGGRAEADRGVDRPALLYDLGPRLGEIKQARQLATEITAQGAYLYDLLSNEPERKVHREQSVSRPLELGGMEAALGAALRAVRSRTAATRDRSAGAAAAERALHTKLERRRADLARAEARMRTLHAIKPAYQGELSALEEQLAALWTQYVVRHRCVEHLKHQLSVLDTQQAEAAEEQQAAIMQLIHKYEAEDVLGKLSDSDSVESSGSAESAAVPVPRARPVSRPRTRLRINTAGSAGGAARRAFGSMAAGGAGGAAGGGDSLDDIRDEDDSLTESDRSEPRTYGSRWQRPGTRVVRDDPPLVAGTADGDSLGSSSESELRITSAGPALSDNEF